MPADDLDLANLVKESRRQFAVLADEARLTLIEICSFGTNETARIAAAKEILDRGVGKVASQLELSGRDGGPVEVKDVSDSARRFSQRITQMAERAAATEEVDE